MKRKITEELKPYDQQGVSSNTHLVLNWGNGHELNIQLSLISFQQDTQDGNVNSYTIYIQLLWLLGLGVVPCITKTDNCQAKLKEYYQ